MSNPVVQSLAIVVGASVLGGLISYLLFSVAKAMKPTRQLVCPPPHQPCCDAEAREEVKTALAETVKASRAMQKVAERHA